MMACQKFYLCSPEVHRFTVSTADKHSVSLTAGLILFYIRPKINVADSTDDKPNGTKFLIPFKITKVCSIGILERSLS